MHLSPKIKTAHRLNSHKQTHKAGHEALNIDTHQVCHSLEKISALHLLKRDLSSESRASLGSQYFLEEKRLEGGIGLKVSPQEPKEEFFCDVLYILNFLCGIPRAVCSQRRINDISLFVTSKFLM